MLIRELIKKTVAYLLLTLFLLSTSGMVLYYHFCDSAEELFVSVYVDNTEEYCKTSAQEQQYHNNSNCCHTTGEDKCCDNHNTSSTTVKLSTSFFSPNPQETPKAIILLLLFSCENSTITDLDEIKKNTKAYHKFLETIPISPSGKDIIIQNHILKIHC